MKRMAVATSSAKPFRTWKAIVEAYERAERNGSAYRTETRAELLREASVDATCVLRVAVALRDKPKADLEKKTKEWRNPFLPYDKDLWCCDLSDTHVLLLNKFNVVPHHTLVVTKEFRSQEEPLDEDDIEALWDTIVSYPAGALAFFNSGPKSGKSQPHKHVQVVPLPLADELSQLPFHHLIVEAWKRQKDAEIHQKRSSKCFSVDSLPFVNFVCMFDGSASTGEVLNGYQEVYHHIEECTGDNPVSYNLLITKQWMMAVPRSLEMAGPVSVNALGFAGTFLVRNQEEINYMRNHGCLEALKIVGLSSQAEPRML